MIKTLYFCIGSQNDSTVFNYSDFNQLLATSSANIPQNEAIPNCNINIPYYLLGDGGLPLKKYLMTPYARGAYTPHSEEIFNKKLSSARSTIERAFGVLANKWKILQQAMNFKLETTNAVVMALVCLHNFIITQELSGQQQSYTTSKPNEANFQLDGLNVNVDVDCDADGMRIRSYLTRFLVSRRV